MSKLKPSKPRPSQRNTQKLEISRRTFMGVSAAVALTSTVQARAETPVADEPTDQTWVEGGPQRCTYASLREPVVGRFLG